MNCKLTRIDSDKLRQALKSRNLGIIECSRGLGYSSTYINTVLKRGSINTPGIKALEAIYNIPYAEYKYVPKADVDSESAKTTFGNENVSADKLYNIIYSAVYKAIVDARGAK